MNMDEERKTARDAVPAGGVEDEAALRRLNAQLAQRVSEQTAELRKSYAIADAERQRLYDVLETLPVYVILLSKDYHVPFANKFFRERFGESRDRRCFDYLFQRTEPCENCESYKALTTGTPHHWYWTGPDGRDYDIYDFPFKDTDGSLMVMEMGMDITETNKARTALQELNATLERRVGERTADLQAVLDLAPVAIWIAHDAGCVKITGNRHADEVVMRVPRNVNISAGAPSDEAAVSYKVFREGVELRTEELPAQLASSTGKPVSPESLDLVFSDGRVAHMFMGAAPLFDADGRVRGAVVAGTDVTSLKEVEEALRQNQSKLKGILDATRESIWLFSADGVVLMANDTAFSRLGRTATSTIGRNFAEILPPDLAKSRMAKFREVVSSASPVEFEDERDGILFRHSFYPILGSAKGVVTSVVSYSRDITQEKRAEEALRVSHARLALAQKAAKAGAWEWDIATGKLEWSLEMFSLFGLDPATKEAGFDAWRKAMHPEDRQAAEDRINAAVRDRRSLHNEYRVVLPSGENRWISAVGEASYDDSGRPVRMSGLCFDITLRKGAEERIHRHAEELRTINDELTRFNRVAVDRELRMIELKKEVNELRVKSGLPPAYRVEADEGHQ